METQGRTFHTLGSGWWINSGRGIALLGALQLLFVIGTWHNAADAITVVVAVGIMAAGIAMGAASKSLRVEVDQHSLRFRGIPALRRTIPLTEVAVVRQVDLSEMGGLWRVRLSVVKFAFIPKGEGLALELRRLLPHPLLPFIGYRMILFQVDREPAFLASMQAVGVRVE